MSTFRRTSYSRAAQRGLTLIEVMVAVLVMSIGLLGMASLQLNALRGNTGAFWRSQATWFAYDMSDRLRSNQPGVASGAYDALDTNGATDPGCITTGCTATDMADYDAFAWGQMLAALPAGQGTVTRNGDLFTVRVYWDDARSGATGLGCDPSDPTDLTCISITVRP